mmetsp:Transcript_24563/g.62659  ORF Transcript_24563/g.62659 Transcript_24563/m.62659 type:complete len:237 (+) Transcript_24563:389-1099(+)
MDWSTSTPHQLGCLMVSAGILGRWARRCLRCREASHATGTPPTSPSSSGRSTAPPSPSLTPVASVASARVSSLSVSTSSTTLSLGRQPTVRSLEREAAAVSAGIDLLTYNALMDLQHRDITPEDYDTLRRLDTAVTPKTLSPQRLEQLCPSWTMTSAGVGACIATDGPVTRAAAQSHKESEGDCCPACCICLEEVCSGERVRRLPCRHILHSACIDEWLTTSSDLCPECNQPVAND